MGNFGVCPGVLGEGTSSSFIIMSVYAPTLANPDVKTIPDSIPLFLLGDFNARVGYNREAWPTCLGHFGVGKINDNGQRLLELCYYFKLCVTNTFFKSKASHKVSWRRCLRTILAGISWQDKVTNKNILERCGIPSMFTLLRQRRLRWLGHVRRMDDKRIPKNLLYGELATGKRSKGHPFLHFKDDVCKRDMKAMDIDVNTWEEIADDCNMWRE